MKDRRSIKNRVAFWTRWLHTYLSMLGLCALFFFAVTGVTLNHPDWFYADHESERTAEGEIELAVLPPAKGLAGDGVEKGVDKLGIVELLRERHGIRGALSEFSIDERECVVIFKGPGYSADVFIDRRTRGYEFTELTSGFVAVINDLHKGRDTGAAWSVVIDVSSIVTALISVTGLVLMLFIKRRRRSGLVMAGLGTVLLVVVLVWLVP